MSRTPPPQKIREMYDAESAATAAEAAATAREVGTDPEAARGLWQVVLAMAPTDPQFSMLLQSIVNSAVIDQIANAMQRDDAYALVMGRRMNTLMEAIKPGLLQPGKKVTSS